MFITSNLANEIGVSVPTIRSWVSILEASYITFFVQPFFENIGKRLIKSPKLFFYDVGLASYLLGIENVIQLERDPLRGALVENLVIVELLKARFNKGLEQNIFFYRDSNQNEVDALLKSGNYLIPIEIKSSSTYHQDFLKNLIYIKKILKNRIQEGYIVYTGTHEQKLKEFNLINYKKVSSLNNSNLHYS